MKRACAYIAVVFLFTALSSAVKPGYEKGKLIDASQGAEGTQVVYRLHILVGRQLYYVEQRPTFFLNAYSPAEFFINGPVLVRVNDRFLYLLRPYAKREMRMAIKMKIIIEDDAQLAELNRIADKPPSSDQVADMLDDNYQRQQKRQLPIPW